MKKLLSVILVLALCLTMGTAAMAGSFESTDDADAVREANREKVKLYFEVEEFSEEQNALLAPNFRMEQPFWGVGGAEDQGMGASVEMPAGFQMPNWTPEWHWNDDLEIWGTDDPNFFFAHNSGYGLQLNGNNELAEYSNEYFHTFHFDENGQIDVYQEIGNPLNLMVAMGKDFDFPQPSDTLNELIDLYLEEQKLAAMTEEERAWWESYEVPYGMDKVDLYPDENLALREKNYETVCRFMQGLSPYLYLLYTDDVVTGVAFDFSLTKDAMRNSDMTFQKMLDASNAEMYPDWTWTNIKVFQSDDPNVFVVECDGCGTLTENGEAVRFHADHYLHKFTLEDGLIKEYIEFNNPIQELTEMGYSVSPAGGGGSSEEPEDEGPVNENGLTAGEQAWWDAFQVPEGMDVPLFPDGKLALREKNYEAVCRYMQGLNKYIYLLYTDDVKTGVAYDFDGTSNPFNPVMTRGIAGAAAMDSANAAGYPDWEWSNYHVYQSDDPNVFLVEVDGHGGTHSDHYMHEFILRDGKIAQYIEFNSPLNEAIENGYEVPPLR